MAARTGVRQFRTFYTWPSWVFGWLGRLITQALFFTSFGLLLKSHAAVQYIAVGNAVVLACMEALAVLGLLARERWSGALLLHVAVPDGMILGYVARNIYCVALGIFSSTFGFFIMTLLFKIHLPWPEVALVPLLIGLISLSTYAFGFAFASAILGVPSLSMVAVNLSYLSMMAFGGVNVPVSFWPEPIRVLADALPLTYGLLAIRQLLAGAPAAVIWRDSLLEVVVGLCWLGAGVAMFRLSRHVGRRTGSLQLSA